MSLQNVTSLAARASQHVPGEGRAIVSDHARLEAGILEDNGITAAVSTSGEAPAASSGLTVLVVDDSRDMRAYVRGCLLQPGTPVSAILEAADGRQALERLRQGGIDLVISDVVMPHMDGMALCRALQADANLASLPVLLITGEGIPSMLPDGVSGVLAKPFNATKLQASMRDVLSNASVNSPRRAAARRTLDEAAGEKD